MKWLLTLLVVAAFLYSGAALSVTQHNSGGYATSGVSLTLGDPIGSVYQAGEDVGFSIQTDSDAYVVVFDMDTDGFVHLLYPETGGSLQKLSAHRVYEIPADPDRSLVVSGADGIEFVFALAVENRDYINDAELRFLAEDESLPENRRFRITGDPLLGANRVASQVVRGIANRPGVTMAFTYFYVGTAVDFPRYLCEECYDKGKDPYASGMPVYVASADFQKTDRLTYPLAQGFVRDYPDASPALSSGVSVDDGSSSQVTKVYVSYYPRWDTGYYDTSWWYLDPWYWDWWYAPYSSAFYFGFGWGGWWGCRYAYFPYYYWGGYPAYYPCYPYYGCYPDHYGHGYGYGGEWRSFRPTAKGGYGNDLYTAMNYKTTKDVRARQFAAASPKRTNGMGAKELSELDRRSVVPSHFGGVNEPRVIRSRPTSGLKPGYDQLQRDARRAGSKTVTQREQRVITRSSKASRSTPRSIDTRGVQRKAGEIGRTVGEPRKGAVDSSRPTSRSKSEGRSYAPNTRRDSGSRGGQATRSSGQSRGSSSRGGSSSSGKGSSSRTRH
jgi:hypothetical protein